MWVEISDMWLKIAGVLGAVVLSWNAFKAISNFFGLAKAPNKAQDKRLDDLEARIKSLEHALGEDKELLGDLQAQNKVVLQSLLALLDHGLDGNNTEQMQAAKAALQQHMINK